MGPSAIDIIIPVYKSVALTGRCLRSIAQNIQELAAYEVRLSLINDSPGDPEVTALLGEFAAARSYVWVYENEVNRGFVGTVNRGLELACADGRDVILVNADNETYPGTLSNLVKTAYADTQIGFVSPRSNNASLCSLPHLQPGAVPLAPEAYDRWRRLSRTMPSHHFVPTGVGFYLYIKQVVLANLGLLDTSFGVGYEEENDLILRANKVGYRAALANHAYAYHAGGASFSLTGLDLESHRHSNLKLMAKRHPEFLPLLRRYEDSPHFRAESLLASSLPSAQGRLSLVFDLSAMGCDYNGTNEFSVGVLGGLCRRQGSTFDLNVICSANAFKFHGLDALKSLRRIEPALATKERFAIAVRFGQPFAATTILEFERLAPIVVYCMLDTIAQDCGHLSIEQSLDALWGHVADHASGISYISRFSQDSFESRFPGSATLRKYTRLLPTRLTQYQRQRIAATPKHILILGNHFAHKASQATAATLSSAFPQLQFVLMGKETAVSGNVASHKAGLLSEQQVRELYADASVIVLPSYMEGFGFGLVHSLAAQKVIVARDIPATREILATYKSVSGVYLYQDNTQLVSAVESAIGVPNSEVDDSEAHTWDQWADGFDAFCAVLITADDLFPRLVQRIKALDQLQISAHAAEMARPKLKRIAACRSVKQLLALDGEEFVQAAYSTILSRLADTEGLEHYLSELDAGVSKFNIVSRLRESEEGRSKNLPLAGFTRATIAHRLFSRR